MELRSWLIRGTLVGLFVLGISGRLLMRVIAHMEGRTPVFTPEGTMTVVFAGAVAGRRSDILVQEEDPIGRVTAARDRA